GLRDAAYFGLILFTHTHTHFCFFFFFYNLPSNLLLIAVFFVRTTQNYTTKLYQIALLITTFFVFVVYVCVCVCVYRQYFFYYLTSSYKIDNTIDLPIFCTLVPTKLLILIDR